MTEQLLKLLLIAAAAALPAVPLHAQGAGPGAGASDSVSHQNDPTAAEDGRGQDIVVTGIRYRTALAGATPETELDTREIRALGQNNVGDILAALSPQTRGGAGAGPIVLLNGRRISGFSEVSSLPPEAVARIEVLAEEVALRYGYGPGSRVVNIELLPRYTATVGELDHGAATEGGRSTSRAGFNILRIRHSVRWNLDARYDRETGLLESERSLAEEPGDPPFDAVGNVGPAPGGSEIDPALSALAGRPVALAGVPAAAATGTAPGLEDFVRTADLPNLTGTRRYRSLLPERERFAVNGTLSGFVLGDTSAALNLRAEANDSSSLLGLPGATLLVPGQSAVSPFGSTISLYRNFEAAGPLARETESRLGHAGLALNGALRSWFWSLTASYDRSSSRTLTDGGVDVTSLQARLNARDPSLNPFGPLPDLPRRDAQLSRSSGRIGGAELTFHGPVAALPAGPLSASLTAAVQTIGFEARSSLSDPDDALNLSRKRGSLQAGVEIPIASSSGGLADIGNLSASFSVSVSSLSDFGTIRKLNSALSWSPVRALALTGSYTDEDRAPSVEQLGDPVTSTPNVRLFDFARGDTVRVARLDGGNRSLASANRRLLKLGALVRPLAGTDLSIRADYARIRERDMLGAFPVFTTELESAFPDRFQRDADGVLTGVDARPVNFARAARDELRWGVSLSTPFPRRSATGGGDGQFDLALFHSWALRDKALLRAGAPALDFLGGSAAGSIGGRPRHLLELQAGIYRNGLGARLGVNAQSATAVRFPAAAGGGEALSFGGLATANVRLFADLGQRAGLLRRMPWLKDSRLSLSVTNLLGSRMEVRDRDGRTPFGYQPAFLDPVGRSVTLSLRKLFA